VSEYEYYEPPPNSTAPVADADTACRYGPLRTEAISSVAAISSGWASRSAGDWHCRWRQAAPGSVAEPTDALNAAVATGAGRNRNGADPL